MLRGELLPGRVLQRFHQQLEALYLYLDGLRGQSVPWDPHEEPLDPPDRELDGDAESSKERLLQVEILEVDDTRVDLRKKERVRKG